MYVDMLYSDKCALCTIGENYSSLQYVYRIPAQTIGRIIPETCVAIANSLEHCIQVIDYNFMTFFKLAYIVHKFNKYHMNMCIRTESDHKHIVCHLISISIVFVNLKHILQYIFV